MGRVIESRFQRNLIKQIKELFQGAVVMKLDSNYKQGIPDLLILYGKKWATLECKKEEDASHRPNQDWYVDKMNSMSFSRFIYPENKDDVIQELIHFFTNDERTNKA